MIVDSGMALHLVGLRGGVVIGEYRRDREEEAWISRAASGDEAGFRWLLSRYRERVVRVAAATLGGTAEAEDAAQEAFVKAFRTLSRLERKSSFYGWICKITVRVCLDQKRLKRSHELRFTDTSERASCADLSAESVNSILIWQVLNQLSPAMRAALILRELDGLGYDEISESLGIPIGTVRSRLNTARSRFRELWEIESEDRKAASNDQP